MALATDSNRPQPLWRPPPTACLTTPGAASEVPSLLMHPWGLPLHLHLQWQSTPAKVSRTEAAAACKAAVPPFQAMIRAALVLETNVSHERSNGPPVPLDAPHSRPHRPSPIPSTSHHQLLPSCLQLIPPHAPPPPAPARPSRSPSPRPPHSLLLPVPPPTLHTNGFPV